MSVILLISNIIHNNDMHYNFLIISIICDFLKIIFFHVSFQNIKESQHADTLPDCWPAAVDLNVTATLFHFIVRHYYGQV